MTIPEIDRCLDKMTIIVDTREQDTAAFRKRVAAMPCGVTRGKLLSGDYSCKTILPDDTEYSLENKFVIERKMSFGELCANFCRGRERFKREFDRFAENGGKACLIVENASYEALRAHRYNSKMSPEALIASVMAWYAKYDVPMHLCKSETSGWLIYHILRYQLREFMRRDFGEKETEKVNNE